MEIKSAVGSYIKKNGLGDEGKDVNRSVSGVALQSTLSSLAVLVGELVQSDFSLWWLQKEIVVYVLCECFLCVSMRCSPLRSVTHHITHLTPLQKTQSIPSSRFLFSFLKLQIHRCQLV